MTALFADLSGFTTLASQLDTEELLAIVDPLVARLAEIVHRYDGYIEKFAGDALMALFGAPVAHEDDPARALQVALEMHDQMAVFAAESGGMTLHIGVNTGTVVARSLETAGRSQYAALGQPVIMAQRLESAAAPRETRVGELTMRMTRDQFDYDDLGAQAVKGLADPLPMFRLRGRRHAPRPDPARLVGRDAELTKLLDAVAVASSRVRIIGPAGSGKSRLLAKLKDRLHAAGTTCVEIAGVSYSQSAYRCFEPLVVAALRARYPAALTLAEGLRSLETDEQAPEQALYTALLLGQQVSEESLPEEPQAVRRRLSQAASQRLRDLAGQGGVLVLVDNEQWLDASSRDLLHHLVTASVGLPVAFCFAGRTGGETANSAITVELPPLRADDVEELVAQELGLTPDRRLVRFVDVRSAGNPLMIRETVRQLRDDGLLDMRLGHARLVAGAADLSLPTTLEALLAARWDTLDGRLPDVAKAAAAIGFRVPLALLADVVDVDDVDEVVAGLLRLGFLQPGDADEVRFDSMQLREVGYARMTVRNRRSWHARIAEALDGGQETDGAELVRLAEHRYLAGDHERALPLLRKVARRARVVFASDEAIVALTRAAESARAVAPQQVPEILCDSADLRMELGEYERAGKLYAEAKSVDNCVRAWAGEAATLRRRGDYAEGEKNLHRAFAVQPAGDRRLLWCELSWILSVSGNLVGSLEAARAGLALGSEEDGLAGLLLLQIVRAETLQGALDEARAHVDQAIRNLEAAHDMTGQCTALRLLGSLQERQGHLEAAGQSLERGLALAELTGLVEEIGGCLVNLGLVRGALDDHPAASDCYARAALVFEEVGHRSGQALAYGNRAYELFMLGDRPQARELGERALPLALDVGNHYTAADIHHTLALIAESAGDTEGAYRHAHAAIDEFDLAGMPDYAEPSQELAARVRPE